MNKIGIHYAYWSSDWDIDIGERIKYASDVGFEVIDITPPAYMTNLVHDKMNELKAKSDAYQVELSFCIGFPKDQDMSSPNPILRAQGIEYSKRMIEAVHDMGGKMLSGILYSYWPCIYTSPITRQQKEDAWKWGIESIQQLMPIAKSYDIHYAIELVNRFEQFIVNTVEEGIRYCDEIHHPNAGLLVDVFHANIEENNIAESIKKAGDLLLHLHVSENNRRLPGFGNHINWPEIFQALKEINYQGHIVIEPFLEAFGSVGNDLRIWHDLEKDLSKEARDQYARESIAFIKKFLA